MDNKLYLKGKWFPYLLIAPQMAITLVFFIWPALDSVIESTQMSNAFGLNTHFVGLKNYLLLLSSAKFYQSAWITVVFSFGTALLSLAVGLLLAVMANRVVRLSGLYRSFLIWPYAIAPAIAGALWLFMFNPAIGIVSHWLALMGIHWDATLNSAQAMVLVIIAAAWKQISYNILFFLAGLQSIPRSLIEAAAIDGAGPIRRFWSIVFPLLSPTSFFLLIMNLIYAFFETFGVIDIITQGGPGFSTTTLVYKVYQDGFIGLNLGTAGAESVVLMIIVGLLTLVQFKYVEKKVQY